MECVSNSEFSIIINGKNSDWIKARSGFRQGCPLSPYLFILCSQLLSNSFYHVDNELGVKVVASAPKISHLLYADDVLMFLEAKIVFVTKLKRIILDYCKWTGQTVNLNKSSLIFGNSVGRAKRRKFSKILRYKEVNELKYLGIKFCLRRLVTNDYLFILEKAASKINGWGNKFFSWLEELFWLKRLYFQFWFFMLPILLFLKAF
ncbi:hypothetical protein KFK09_022713 [Dendrobium nobile]|uniref:Reverse transcriptase domain-containing protein n=1 Tax=Dendrobium nobile TaxID=94219 RepID=A0A8T3AJI5_DENNO|nr:hypothetical protein KFK09_022713 [Dendrobium nobile]